MPDVTSHTTKSNSATNSDAIADTDAYCQADAAAHIVAHAATNTPANPSTILNAYYIAIAGTYGSSHFGTIPRSLSRTDQRANAISDVTADFRTIYSCLDNEFVSTLRVSFFSLVSDI